MKLQLSYQETVEVVIKMFVKYKFVSTYAQDAIRKLINVSQLLTGP